MVGNFGKITFFYLSFPPTKWAPNLRPSHKSENKKTPELDSDPVAQVIFFLVIYKQMIYKRHEVEVVAAPA